MKRKTAEPGVYRLKTLTQGDLGTMTFVYGDQDGDSGLPADELIADNQTLVIDAFDKKTIYTHNAQGYLTELKSLAEGEATDAEGLTTTYTYDADGNMRSVTNGEGEKTEMRYYQGHDTIPDGLLKEEQDALGNTVKYRYNSDGQLVARTTYLTVDTRWY